MDDLYEKMKADEQEKKEAANLVQVTPDPQPKKIDKQVSLSSKTMEDLGQSFITQTHTVLIVGWGVDPESMTKYWIVRNSYGPRWGQKGHFLVKRGENDFGMEANMISYEPAMCSEATVESCMVV